MNDGDAVRLNLGSGMVELAGYIPIDRKNGKEVYPLAYPDNSVDEIYASHILEHFSHTQVADVLKEWMRALKPGGRMRLAVPDFTWVAEHYLAGEPIDSQGYVMGGHCDADDRHGAIFDYELMVELMINCGLERIGRFESEYKDCTSLPVSLNVMGYKPASPANRIENTVAVLSAPRYGSVMHFRVVGVALSDLHLPYYMGQGAYWHMILSELLEDLIATGAEYIITIDYDSVFGRHEVLELYRLIKAFPQADAVCGVQMSRGRNFALCGVCDSHGVRKQKAYVADFQRHLTQLQTGHFGMTIFRASSLNSLPRPWMLGSPDKEGRWREPKVDPDIDFWRRWQAAGKTLFMANNVLVGHLSEVIRWPSQRLDTIWQEPMDYVENGIPPEVRRIRREPD